MRYTVDSRWDSPAASTAEATYTRLIALGANEPSPGFLRDVIDTLYEFGPMPDVDLNADLMVAHCANETGDPNTGAPFRSPIYLGRGVIDGLGVTDGGDQGLVFTSGRNAALAHMMHLHAYVHGEIPKGHPLYPYILLDPRYGLVIRGGHAGEVTTVKSMTGWWWTDSSGHTSVIKQALSIFDVFTLPVEPGGPQMQLIPVYRNILPNGSPNRPGTKLPATGDLYIAEHETGNEGVGADADNQIAYLQTADAKARYVSYHFSVDDEKFVQGLPLDEIGYHAGDGCDDPSVDIGCFRSIAIEGCVNADGNEAQMRKNYSQLIARIGAGDPAFDWGGGSTRGRFTARKTKTHVQISDPGPNQHHCPDHMLNDGYVPKLNADAIALEDQLKGTVIVSPPVIKPASIYPRGMSLEQSQVEFGGITVTFDGKDYDLHFDPHGPVSIEWLNRIKAQIKGGQDYTAARFGEIHHVTRRGKDKSRWDIRFSDGSTIPYDSINRVVIK